MDPVDRISNLDDNILILILSFIPTIYSVRTCVLSTRWKYLWKSVPALYFSESSARLDFTNYMNDYTIFQSFVDSVLSLRGTSNLYKFHLQCNQTSSRSSIEAWISTATQNKLEELILNIGCASFFTLPHSLDYFDSLKTLHISQLNIPSLPASISFPRLEILHFQSVRFSTDRSTQHVSFIFPILQEFTMDTCYWLETLNVNIYAPTLKKLSLIDYKEMVNFPETKINIDAKSLQLLLIHGELLLDYSFTCLTSLVKASLKLGSGSDSQRALNCLTSTSSVKHLTISASSIENLAHAGNLTSLQIFPNLSNLGITNRSDEFNVVHLIHLLRSMPNIESLVLGVDNGVHYACEDDDFLEGDLVAENLPELFLLKLKSVVIKDLKARKSQICLVRYLLAKTLQKMTISICIWEEPEKTKKILEWLPLLPKGSPGTTVVVV